MEILIAGLILVALMAYASTKIKKRAAEAFESELIENEAYSLQKPDGFLHVIDSPDHSLEAYSREFDEGDFRARRAKIELQVFRDRGMDDVVGEITKNARRADVLLSSENISVIETEERNNEMAVSAVYKIIAVQDAIYRLRFAVTDKYRDEYSDKINRTLESFAVKSN